MGEIIFIGGLCDIWYMCGLEAKDKSVTSVTQVTSNQCHIKEKMYMHMNDMCRFQFENKQDKICYQKKKIFA